GALPSRQLRTHLRDEGSPLAPYRERQAVMHVKTLQRHIGEQQRQHATATAEFSWVLSGITLATKAIASQVRRIGLGDLKGAAGGETFQGETLQKMDRFADEVILECLGYRDQVSVMVSEENQE